MDYRFRPLWASPKWVGLGLLLIGGLVAVILTARRPAAQPIPLTGCGTEISLLRALAMVDPARLANELNRSVSLVAAGEFLMGSDSGRDDERPQHKVTLDAYLIDCFEVSNAQFAAFLAASQRAAPPYWSEQAYPSGQADFPVVGVSWDDADAYCKWVGKRLPTEAEWEKAARGLDGRTYPWGEDWDPSRANVYGYPGFPKGIGSAAPALSTWDQAWEFLRNSAPQSGLPALKPVGSYPGGISPYGLFDTVGNASEWVADWYNWGDYSGLPASNPRVTAPPWNHVVRGSPWYDPVGNAAWIQTMSRVAARSSSHDTRDPRIGFRCAKNAP